MTTQYIAVRGIETRPIVGVDPESVAERVARKLDLPVSALDLDNWEPIYHAQSETEYRWTRDGANNIKIHSNER